jgi:DNA-binding beta-propeller fold protein YncE
MALALGAVGLLAVALLGFGRPTTSEPLLVADLRGHALLVLDPSEPEAMRRIALPGGPHELLRLPDGRVVVSLEQSGALAIVDVGSGTVDLLEVGGEPHGLALDGANLLVTDRSVNAIRRFDVSDWSERSSIPVDAWPHAVGIGVSGELIVASASAGTLAIGQDHHQTGATTETVAVALDGRIATASALDGVVSVFGADGALEATYAVGGRPVRVMFAPDGASLAVALSASHAVAIVEDGRAEIVAIEGVPDGLAFSTDGTTLFASDVYGGRVTAVSVSERRVTAVMRVGVSTGAMLVLDR